MQTFRLALRSSSELSSLVGSETFRNYYVYDKKKLILGGFSRKPFHTPLKSASPGTSFFMLHSEGAIRFPCWMLKAVNSFVRSWSFLPDLIRILMMFALGLRLYNQLFFLFSLFFFFFFVFFFPSPSCREYNRRWALLLVIAEGPHSLGPNHFISRKFMLSSFFVRVSCFTN